MAPKDYYRTLGVAQDAGVDDIKKSFRRLARKFHPDVSKEADAGERMKEINEAYTVLSDAEKRAEYDEILRAPQRAHAAAKAAGAESDFFHHFFGAGARAREGAAFRMRGEDLHAHIDIALEDAFTGAVREVTVHAPAFDEAGRLHARQHVLNVQIPKGVHAGQHIRLRGQGAPGLGGAAAGDLFLEVRFRPRPGFRIEGADVYQALPVTPWEAALGSVIDADTPAGRFQVSIPAGSQAGRKLRLKGRGIPGAQPGNLFLVVEVVLPSATTEAQRAVYQAMAQAMPFNPREQKEAQT